MNSRAWIPPALALLCGLSLGCPSDTVQAEDSAAMAHATDIAAVSTADEPAVELQPLPESEETILPVALSEEPEPTSDAWRSGKKAGAGVLGGTWFEADYLLLWIEGNPLPPLVTTNATVPTREDAGVIGRGDTAVLLEGRLDGGARSGLLLSGGAWLDPCQRWGLQASWFYVGAPSDELNAGWQSAGQPVLARPFVNAATGMEDAELVAYPEVLEGTVTAATRSDLQSAEALLSWTGWRGSAGRVGLLGGYRYLRFREGLAVEEQLISREPGGVIQIGTEIAVLDRLDASNTFHGGEIGLLAGVERGPLALDIVGKLGLGNVRRTLDIDGTTSVRTPAGSSSTGPGGLLALPSNMGRYTSDAFGILPELNLRGRVALTDHLSLSVGYNLLFLTEVLRTGAQIDRTVDTSQLPGFLPGGGPPADEPRPVATQDSSTLWAQGVNVGVLVSF